MATRTPDPVNYTRTQQRWSSVASVLSFLAFTTTIGLLSKYSSTEMEHAVSSDNGNNGSATIIFTIATLFVYVLTGTYGLFVMADQRFGNPFYFEGRPGHYLYDRACCSSHSGGCYIYPVLSLLLLSGSIAYGLNMGAGYLLPATPLQYIVFLYILLLWGSIALLIVGSTAYVIGLGGYYVGKGIVYIVPICSRLCSDVWCPTSAEKARLAQLEAERLERERAATSQREKERQVRNEQERKKREQQVLIDQVLQQERAQHAAQLAAAVERESAKQEQTTIMLLGELRRLREQVRTAPPCPEVSVEISTLAAPSMV